MTQLDTVSLFQRAREAKGDLKLPYNLDLDPFEEFLSRVAPDVIAGKEPPPHSYIPIGEPELDDIIQKLPITWKYSRKWVPTTKWGYGEEVIILPFPDQFTGQGYRHAVIHEVMHWTGGNSLVPGVPTKLSRLNRRKFMNGPHEELVAELATAMALSDFGLQTEWDLELVADYLHSWMEWSPAEHWQAEWEVVCKEAEDAVYFFRNGKAPNEQASP